MDKVLVNVFVPVLGESFDVFIPRFLSIGMICKLLGKAIAELSNENYVSSGQELLCSVEKQQILSFDYSFEDYKVKNGEKLIFC